TATPVVLPKRLRLHCGSTTKHWLSGNQLLAVPRNIQTCHCPTAKVCGSPRLKWFLPKAGHCFPKGRNQICPSKCRYQRNDRFFSRAAKKEWDRSFTKRAVRT